MSNDMENLMSKMLFESLGVSPEVADSDKIGIVELGGSGRSEQYLLVPEASYRGINFEKACKLGITVLAHNVTNTTEEILEAGEELNEAVGPNDVAMSFGPLGLFAVEGRVDVLADLTGRIIGAGLGWFPMGVFPRPGKDVEEVRLGTAEDLHEHYVSETRALDALSNVSAEIEAMCGPSAVVANTVATHPLVLSLKKLLADMEADAAYSMLTPSELTAVLSNEVVIVLGKAI